MEKIPKPLRDRVVVQYVNNEETTTDSGIILPGKGSDDGEIIRTIVLAVGRGAIAENGTLIKPEVQVGDEIVFQKGLEDEITIDSRTYLVILEAEIIAVIKNA